MGELTLERMQVWEVTEVGYFGRKVVRAVFSDEAEAWARYQELAQKEPALAQQGALQVGGRTLEVPRVGANTGPGVGPHVEGDHRPTAYDEPPGEKMRRAGRDYEDKAIKGADTVYLAGGPAERTLR
jgi:hypothetical protein